MKKLSILLMLFAILAINEGTFAQSKKKAFGKEMKSPLTEKKYASDKDFYRARGIHKSKDEGNSERNAIRKARNELAATIKSTVRSVTQSYTDEIVTDDESDFKETIETLATTIVDQSVRGATVMETKTTVSKDKDPQTKEKSFYYTVYAVCEVSTQSLMASLEDKILEEEKLKMKYNREKFREIYEKELNSISESSGD